MNFNYGGVLGGGSPEVKTFAVVAGTTASISQGDIVTIANGYAVYGANGVGASGTLMGWAVNASNETSGAAGTVDVMFAPQGLILRGKATTPGNLDASTLYDKVTLDESTGVQTIDENDPGANGILLYNYPFSDYATTGVVDVVIPFGNCA